MWFFDWFYTQFWNLRTYFQNLGDTLNSVPALGGYFAYPFWYIASFFWNLSTASQTASSWSDSVSSIASTAWNTANSAYTYAYGWLTQKVNDAWNYATTTYIYAYGWLTTTLNNLTATFWLQITALITWKDGFINLFWTQINAINTWRNEILALIPSQEIVTDWIESSLAYLTTTAIALVTANAASFADQLWQCVDKIVGKLTEYKE